MDDVAAHVDRVVAADAAGLWAKQGTAQSVSAPEYYHGRVDPIAGLP